MQPIPVPFGEWLPDQADYENPGLVEAKNVIPTPKGYAPWLDGDTGLYSFTDERPYLALSDRVANVVTFGEDNVTLLRRTSGTWASVDSTSSGDLLALPNISAPPGSITRFGNVFIVAASSMSTSYIDTAAGSPTWTALTMPSGVAWFNCVARVGSFLMGGGETGATVYWSAFNDYSDFVPSQRTQAGFGELDTPELGQVTNIVGGRSNLVFQRRGVSRFDYVGTPLIWRDTLISSEFGCVGPMAAATLRDLVYFVSNQGFCVTDGASVQNIGSGIVDEYMRGLFNFDSDSTIEMIRVTADVGRRLVIISFPTGEDATSNQITYSNHIVYSERTNSFSRLEQDYGAFFNISDPDDEGRLKLYGFKETTSGDFDMYQMSGDALAAEMTTGHSSLVPGARVEINDFEPVYTGSGATCAVSTKQTINGSATVTSYASQNASTGICNVLGSGRTAAASVRFPAAASWSEFAGVIANSGLAGTR